MRPIGLGFQTAGHATLICYDGGPVLATDPWLAGSSAWGSWQLTHDVPHEQRDAVEACPFLWISQDRSDHLHVPTLEGLSKRGRTALVPDHRGGRLAARLERLGLATRVLRDGEWVDLSDRIRVMSIGDVLLQAVLLVEIGGRLIVNTNEAGDRGVRALLQRTICNYEISYLLSGSGHEVPWVRTVDDDDRPCVTPPPPGPLGVGIETLMGLLGVTYFVPLSRMRRHAREDSAWANPHMLSALAHHDRFWLEDKEVLPPFVHWDFESGGITVLDPAENLDPPQPAVVHGDDWSEGLSPEESALLDGYIRGVTHLVGSLDEVTFVVGGEAHHIPLSGGTGRGLRVEAPRASLMDAIREEKLDEFLRAGFAKVRLVGAWETRDPSALFPDVMPFLALAEAGVAKTPEEIGAHVADYQARGLTSLAAAGVEGQRLVRVLEPYTGAAIGQERGQR